MVRMPGRRFPGCVIQGDTLSGLVHLAELVLRKASRVDDEELHQAAQELYGELRSRLDHYERVLKSHGIEFPYVKRKADPDVED